MNLEALHLRLRASFERYIGGIVDALPDLLSGLLLLLAGWLVAKLLRSVAKRTVGGLLDAWAARTGVQDTLGRLGGSTASAVLGSLVYALVLFVFVMAAADVMGLEMIGRGMQALMAYLPTLFTALAIFLAGLWLGERISRSLQTVMTTAGLSNGRSIGQVFGGLIILFTTITALNMAGVNTDLITSNIQILLAGVLLAFGLAYGFAARDVLTNILSSFYGKDRFKPGMHLRIGSDEGIVVRIDSISVTLEHEGRQILVPTSRLVTERIEIISENEPVNDRT